MLERKATLEETNKNWNVAIPKPDDLTLWFAPYYLLSSSFLIKRGSVILLQKSPLLFLSLFLAILELSINYCWVVRLLGVIQVQASLTFR